MQHPHRNKRMVHTSSAGCIVHRRPTWTPVSYTHLLDGFPRTIPQAEALENALNAIEQKLDYAIDIDVPDENIINRMSGRRACVGCGATYHVLFNPTKVEGKCDVCGLSLIHIYCQNSDSDH